MISTGSLQEACHRLFADYPLAVRGSDDRDGATSSMILMLREGNDARFFTLVRDRAEREPSYMLHAWPGESTGGFPGAGTVAADAVSEAVAHGVPLPADGSLFGWACQYAVTALIAVYASRGPASAQPSWAVMPRVGATKAEWPPFTEEHLFGPWFWDYHRTGSILPLADLIAGTPNTVFWAHTEAILGSGCCAVARDLQAPGGHVLPRGSYVYYQVLQAGTPIPSLGELLAGTGTTDLAPRFP